MSYASQAASYREIELLSAGPERLVVICFEQLVVQLTRARLAIEQGDTRLRVAAMTKSRAIIAELLATLDFERGGRIAVDLAALYRFALSELAEQALVPDAKRVAALVQIAADLRDGFAGAAQQVQPPLKRPA
ncbi:MAG: flagellar export chaperone FliS [Gemmatimonadaceae bacterium]|jgi:flagellar protein FliS|nr:flagellar export chaperone FliS [Gemmatimonadaceae bacterium]